ncbi:unnamed protein product [Amoebophrya sp. A120]|nr:unnamed protein product [Amoebophrya sp. A120]|eukprot:GSA120T00008144001.1
MSVHENRRSKFLFLYRVSCSIDDLLTLREGYVDKLFMFMI